MEWFVSMVAQRCEHDSLSLGTVRAGRKQITFKSYLGLEV